MIVLRDVNLPSDREAILGIDTTVRCDRAYRVVLGERNLRLEQYEISPPLEKRYATESLVSEPLADWITVAEVGGLIVGVAAVAFERWNRRARLEHLYVHAEARGRGIGRTLVDSAIEVSRRAGMRCLWVETQSINAPAVAFYRKMGFSWCGLDTSLYDPAEVDSREVPLFFFREL